MAADAADEAVMEEAVAGGEEPLSKQAEPQTGGDGSAANADVLRDEALDPLPILALDCDRLPFALIHGSVEDAPCAFHKVLLRRRHSGGGSRPL